MEEERIRRLYSMKRHWRGRKRTINAETSQTEINVAQEEINERGDDGEEEGDNNGNGRGGMVVGKNTQEILNW